MLDKPRQVCYIRCMSKEYREKYLNMKDTPNFPDKTVKEYIYFEKSSSEAPDVEMTCKAKNKIAAAKKFAARLFAVGVSNGVDCNLHWKDLIRNVSVL